MLFNSLAFLIFFPVVTLLYFLVPHALRWGLLLFASCFFYMFFKPEYMLILGFTIFIDYWAGILIEGATEPGKRKRYLSLSIIANVGVLAVFKYYNFFNNNVSGLALLFGVKNMLPVLKMALPIGLSFHTFQAMSYTIEVYRGKQKAERHFGIYSLYVMFYPQLVAGPIERPQNLIHQFREKHSFNYDMVMSGLKLMMWGMFKKVVIADRLALVTDRVFGNPHKYSATTLGIAVVFFAFQIYCDFSGYSDIAIGSARVMGFKLMRNFNRPYAAISIADFWRRWHISLSGWFRDYLYIPLGGSRVSIPRMYVNIMIVFVVSGLWHGANWTFVLWGALYGVYYIIGIIARKIRSNSTIFTGIGKISWLDKTLQIIATFTLVSLAWVFFRANSVADAGYILQSLLSVPGEVARMVLHHSFVSDAPTSPFKLLECVAVIILLEVVQYVHAQKNINTLLAAQPRYLRWGVYYAGVLAIIYFGIFENREFIYFQF